MSIELQHYLMLLDFDGTAFDTFAPSPNGISVDIAHFMAIHAMFGEVGVNVFMEIGGLRNRAPGELIRALLEENAKLREQADALRQTGFYSNFPWGEKTPEWILTEVLIWEKMRIYLLEMKASMQAGGLWPQAFPGVPEFFGVVNTLNTREEFCLDIGIVSSGHTLFIENAFTNRRLRVPEILVTDDHLRPWEYPLDPSERTKPGFFPFALALLSWRKAQYTRTQQLLSLEALAGHVAYVGDDCNKDGGFARENGIPFCHFVPKQPTCVSNGHVEFNHWQQMSDWLLRGDTIRGFQMGVSLSEILSTLNAIEV